MLHSPLLAAARGLALTFFVLAAGFLVLQPALWLRLTAAPALIRGSYRVICRLAGLEVRVSGHPLADGPALLVANHISYLDVPVLASVGELCFVAKSELRGWPVFGYLSVLQRVMFVERDPRRARQQAAELRRRLEEGDRLVVFPEGTSGDGNFLLPFKSSLFAGAEATVGGAPVSVQPVSIAYVRFDNLPMGRFLRPLCAWSGDAAFVPHMLRFLGAGRVGVDVHIHAPVDIAAAGSRKALARHCERLVARSFSRAIAGDPPEPSVVAPESPDGPPGRPGDQAGSAGDASGARATA